MTIWFPHEEYLWAPWT